MGTEVSVASVAYNMAGEEISRPSYLKTVMIRKPFAGKKATMNEIIQNGLLKGPAMKLRNFYRWVAAGNFNKVGLPTGSLRSADDALNYSTIAGEIDDEGSTVTVSYAELSQGQALFWAEKWIAENRPTLLASDWACSIDDVGELITIVFPPGSPDPLIEVIPATTPTFSSSSWFIFARYTLASAPTVERRFIYALGGGNATLDALISSSASYGSFFPFIPLRRKSQFLSSTYLSSTFEQTTKAYKKVMSGADINELIDQLEENEDIDDIDYAYVVFGVSLNVIEKECRKYLFAFFSEFMDLQQGGPTSTSTDKTNQITIKGTETSSADYNIRLEWRYVNLTAGVAGLGKVGAEAGDIWFEKNGSVSGHERIKLFWQRTSGTYDYLTIVGLIHRNYIYGSNRVTIKAHAALDDDRESGFIVPLHYDVWRQTSLVSTSQMATACVWLVFNCYEVYATPWWESWFFQIFIVVAIAVVGVVLTGGVGTVGLLGSSALLGTTLGFTGLTATIVGSVINALAAMVLTSLIYPLIEDVAGPLAPVVMMILTFAIGQAASSGLSTGTITINWADLLKVDNLLALTNALGTGVSQQIQENTLMLNQQAIDYVEKAEAESKKIQQAFFDEFGYGRAIIDPLMFVDPVKGPITESRDTFLTRTLMTGSEIAAMSRELVYEFPTHTLALPDAFS